MGKPSRKKINLPCPYCNKKSVETAATTPYVRGFLVAYQVGSKSYIGCASCIKKKVLGEVGLSGAIGWFSITALFINPLLICYNLISIPFISPNYAKARKKLKEAGIPEDMVNVDITDVGCSLAVAMIAADGSIDDEEIVVAEEVGKKIFGDFSSRKLRAKLNNAKKLPDPQDIASLLRDVLEFEGKKAICTYLWMIAAADGNVDDSEKELLITVSAAMGFDLNTIFEEE